MPISVHCPCGAQFRVRDEYAGKKAQCPTCGEPVVIPTADQSPAYMAAPGAAMHEPGGEFAQFPAPSSAAAAGRRGAGSKWLAGLDSGLFGLGRLSGLACLLIGLIFVLMARGCDSLASRSAASYTAEYELAQNEFSQEWEDKRVDLQNRIDNLQENIDDLNQKMLEAETPSARDGFRQDIDDYRKQMADEREKLDELAKDEQKSRREKERGEWRSLRTNAQNAAANNTRGRYWRELLFVFGTVVLSIGLLTVGFTGEKHERLICLIMITIITFSIYIGGMAWVPSAIPSPPSAARGLR